MHSELHSQMADERAATLIRSGGPQRALQDVVIRAARPDDRPALAALAELDAARPPLGAALVAEVGGAIRAALPLDGGRAFSDPFVRTRDLIALLEARAGQLASRSEAPLGARWLAPVAQRWHVQ